ncbi:Rieske (2Fe-2S) protein [Mycobacterium asiaticum]|uniref:(2Fe-2S)-binding protein n=1 Tax=Mycobacterium asiaticum TaxID=1790 RepID=A0A1A3N439_MYCAS|nr:Rieske (2Fe-2S) protein [Mycobacterium asiaticum]OBK16913.1 (2Fe-2S)-binding protein [Mycobacterium asiaticum]
MSGRTVRRFVDGLLRGRPTGRANPDNEDVQEMRTAIELRAARQGSDAPREEFLSDLHRKLAEALDDAHAPVDHRRRTPGRRELVIGGSVAAASAAAGLVAGRNLMVPAASPTQPVQAQGQLVPNTGAWQRVGTIDQVADGTALAFALGSISGFVHRAGDRLEAVSGICTHHGCKLWLDAPEQRLRCPCHSTSFSLSGTNITHQLPVAPAPLPKLRVRETGGIIEVFAPPE